MSRIIKWIGCRSCDTSDCTGCNVYILEQALMRGVFDGCMEHGTVRVESVEELGKKREAACWGCQCEKLSPPWISVEERLPEKDGTYLVCYNSRFFPSDKPIRTTMDFSHNLEKVDDYDFAGLNRPGWYDCSDDYTFFERDGVTHWMPLPEPPVKEEEDDGQ